MNHLHDLIKKSLIAVLLSLMIVTTIGCDYELFENDYYSEDQYFDNEYKKRSYSRDEIMYEGPDDYSFDDGILIEAEIHSELDAYMSIDLDHKLSEKEKKKIDDKYKEVLSGISDIEYYTCDAKSNMVLNYQATYYYYETKTILDFSVRAVFRIDFDGDGSKEVVLKIDDGPDFADEECIYNDNLLVLHYYDGKVYANKISFYKLNYLGENGIIGEIDQWGNTVYCFFTFTQNEFYVDRICYETQVTPESLYEEGYSEEEAARIIDEFYYKMDSNDTENLKDESVFSNDVQFSYDSETVDNSQYYKSYIFQYYYVERELYAKIEHYIRKDGEVLSYTINGEITEEEINRIFK